MKTQNQAEASSGCNYIKRYLSLFVSICLYHSCAFSLTFAKDVLPTSHSFFPPSNFPSVAPGLLPFIIQAALWLAHSKND